MRCINWVGTKSYCIRTVLYIWIIVYIWKVQDGVHCITNILVLLLNRGEIPHGNATVPLFNLAQTSVHLGHVQKYREWPKCTHGKWFPIFTYACIEINCSHIRSYSSVVNYKSFVELKYFKFDQNFRKYHRDLWHQIDKLWKYN